MQVSELMIDQVIAINVDKTLQQAAKRMIRYGVGSIVVVEKGEPAGIITRTDIMEAGVATDEPFSRLPVETVMTNPVVTVRPTATVRNAIEVMEENGVKHLPVADTDDLHGIIASSDIVAHHENW
jgi:CBS domain-containing protein